MTRRTRIIWALAALVAAGAACVAGFQAGEAARHALLLRGYRLPPNGPLAHPLVLHLLHDDLVRVGVGTLPVAAVVLAACWLRWPWWLAGGAVLAAAAVLSGAVVAAPIGGGHRMGLALMLTPTGVVGAALTAGLAVFHDRLDPRPGADE